MSTTKKRSVVWVARHSTGVEGKENVNCSQGRVIQVLIPGNLTGGFLREATRRKSRREDFCYRCGAPRTRHAIRELGRIENEDIGWRSNAKYRGRRYQLFFSGYPKVVGVPYEKVQLIKIGVTI